MIKRTVWKWLILSVSLGCAGCTSETPQVVASNCDKADCVTKQALKIDAVDILLVVDDSASMVPEIAALKSELPRLLTAITTGEGDDNSFPPAKSVHVAVTTTDIGIGTSFGSCTEHGRDAVFVRPGEVGVTCEQSYPGYLAYEGGPAAVATVDSVGCVPLVFSNVGSCGFEQPLEAALKSLWPATNSDVTFVAGMGHGSAENAGFLRDNSLLVVVVVTDEDDCSATDDGIFQPANQLPEGSPYTSQDINLRCYYNKDKLRAPSSYVEHLKALRPGNDNVVFAAIAGVPADLVSDDFRAHYDFSVPARAQAYYDDVLASDLMQETTTSEVGTGNGNLEPSCVNLTEAGEVHRTMPPRRLVEVAKGFGAQGVLGSLCEPDFGATTGRLVHAIGERLSGISGASAH